MLLNLKQEFFIRLCLFFCESASNDFLWILLPAWLTDDSGSCLSRESEEISRLSCKADYILSLPYFISLEFSLPILQILG